MSEKEYFVHVEQFWVYKITAESPEAAAQVIDDGEAPTGDCTGYDVTQVTETEWDDVDLRQPGRCKKCAQMLRPGRDECTSCLLDRLKGGPALATEVRKTIDEIEVMP